MKTVHSYDVSAVTGVGSTETVDYMCSSGCLDNGPYGYPVCFMQHGVFISLLMVFVNRLLKCRSVHLSLDRVI